MRRVLVTDGEQRAALAIVRSLGRAGYEVDVCSTERRSLAGGSRHCRAEHVVPHLREGVESVCAALDRITAERDIEAIIPTADLSILATFALSRTRPDLRVPIAAEAVWHRATDKHALTDVARTAGVPVPRQHVIGSKDDDRSALDDIAREYGYPVVLKPHRSVVLDDSGLVETDVELVADATAMTRALERYPAAAYPILLQQRVVGPGLGGFFLARSGRVRAAFGHRRLREKPPTGGVSVLRESVPLREDLARHSAALLEALSWDGVAMVEFKEDAATGTPYLMEINGRFWGSLQLAIDAGVDFPRLLLEDLAGEATAGEEADAPVEYRAGVQSRWLLGELDHLIWRLRAPLHVRERHPELPPLWRLVLEFLLPFRPARRHEILRLTDPKPFLRESIEWLRALRGGAG